MTEEDPRFEEVTIGSKTYTFGFTGVEDFRDKLQRWSQPGNLSLYTSWGILAGNQDLLVMIRDGSLDVAQTYDDLKSAYIELIEIETEFIENRNLNITSERFLQAFCKYPDLPRLACFLIYTPASAWSHDPIISVYAMITRENNGILECP